MLPPPSSSEFPAALKARREALGLSRSELARRANIHGVMPRRYEEPDCGEFSSPRGETWVALNKALGYEVEDTSVENPAQEATAAPLTIAQAKAGLALAFGVAPEQIDIIIRG
ncbi:MAG: helix-turn-helix transcriptional regulator [Pseudomonas sp.]